MRNRLSILVFTICVAFSHVHVEAQKFQWVHRYIAGSSSLRDFYYDNSAGIYISGVVDATNSLFDSIPINFYGYNDGFVLKADTTSGDVEWIHTIGFTGIGEAVNHLARFNNNLIVSGYCDYGFLVDTLYIPGGQDPSYIAKFDTSGPYNWLTLKAHVGDLEVDNSGSIYFSGIWRLSPAYQPKYYVYKMNSSGVITDSLFLFQDSNINSCNLICDNKGNIIITQNFRDSITFLGTTYIGDPIQGPNDYDYLMIECDTLLNIKSVKLVSGPGSKFVYDMILDNQGMVKIIAQWEDAVSIDGMPIPGTGNRLAISTLDTNLTLLNYNNINLSCSYWGSSVQIEENDLNEIFLGINYSDNVIIDSDTILAGGSGDGMIVKLNGSQVGWYRTIANDSLSTGVAQIIISKPNGNKLYVAGTMGQSSVVIDTFTFNNNAEKAFTGLVIDTTYGLFTGISTLNQNNSSKIKIIPNPSTGRFKIYFEDRIENGKVEVFNIIGENVFEENIFNESNKEIDIKNILPGIYFARIFEGIGTQNSKIITTGKLIITD